MQDKLDTILDTDKAGNCTCVLQGGQFRGNGGGVWACGMNMWVGGVGMWVGGVGMWVGGVGMWVGGVHMWVGGVGMWVGGVNMWVGGVGMWVGGVGMWVGGVGIDPVRGSMQREWQCGADCIAPAVLSTTSSGYGTIGLTSNRLSATSPQ